MLNLEVEEMAREVAKGLDTVVFDTKIRSSIAVAEAPAHGQSVIDYAPDSRPAQDYSDLIDELLEEG